MYILSSIVSLLTSQFIACKSSNMTRFLKKRHHQSTLLRPGSISSSFQLFILLKARNAGSRNGSAEIKPRVAPWITTFSVCFSFSSFNPKLASFRLCVVCWLLSLGTLLVQRFSERFACVNGLRCQQSKQLPLPFDLSDERTISYLWCSFFITFC